MLKGLFKGRRASSIDSSAVAQATTDAGGEQVPAGFQHRPSSMRILHSESPKASAPSSDQSASDSNTAPELSLDAPAAAAPALSLMLTSPRDTEDAKNHLEAELRMEIWQLKRLLSGIHTRLDRFQQQEPTLTSSQRVKLESIMKQIPNFGSTPRALAKPVPAEAPPAPELSSIAEAGDSSPSSPDTPAPPGSPAAADSPVAPPTPPGTSPAGASPSTIRALRRASSLNLLAVPSSLQPASSTRRRTRRRSTMLPPGIAVPPDALTSPGAGDDGSEDDS